MDIEKYKVLIATINEGSISAAAEKLGYTPSGISRLIHNLESENGFPLLVRSKTGVVATSECKELLPTINYLIQSSENLAQLSAQICGIQMGTITVGSSHNIYYQWLSKVIYEFNLLYPKISFTIVEGTSSSLSKMVENGQADFCIISKREGNFDWIPLCEDELVAVVPPNHPAIEDGFFKLDAIKKEPFIDLYPGRETDNSRFLKKKNIVPNNKYSTSDTYAAYSMVEAGLGISLANKLLAENSRSNIVALPLKPHQLIDIGIAVSPEDIISPATKTFVDFASKFIGDI